MMISTMLSSTTTISTVHGQRTTRHQRHPSVHRPPAPSGLVECFSPKGIKSYDGERDPEAWLRVYTTVVTAAGGSQNTMANYLPVVLITSVQDCLTGLLENSIDSWGDLCARFIDHFQGTYQKPGVDWD